MTNDKAAGQTPSSEEAEKKRKKSSEKGKNLPKPIIKVSKDVSKDFSKDVSKDFSKDVSKDFSKDFSKAPLKKSVINPLAVPKFNDKGVCCRCKSNNMVHESIACQVCNDLFHGCCKDKSGNLMSTSICAPTFLKSISPVIAKFGNTYSERYGYFGWTCPNCNKALLSKKKKIKTTVQTKDSTCNTSMDSTKSVASSSTSTDTTSFNGDENTLSETLRDFKVSLLSSVEEIISIKLKSHVDSLLTDVPNLTCRSSTLSSASDLALQPSSSVSACPRMPNSAPSSSKSYSSLSSSRSYSSVLFPESVIGSPTATEKFIKLAKKETPMQKIPSDNILNNALDNHVIVLNVETSKVNLEEAEKMASNALETIPMNFLTPKPKTGKIVISFPSDQAREKGKMVLANLSAVTMSEITVNDAKKMFPKVTVTNIPNNLISHIVSEKLPVPEFREKVKTYLEVKLLEKNQDVKDLVTNHNRTFKIVYVNYGREYTTAGIKVSPDIRHFLLRNQSIYIGNSRCKVVDRFDLKQCFRCQKLGHISSHCKEADVICMYCSASHMTRACPYKEDRGRHRCTNCSHSTYDPYRESCSTHHSGAENCPIITLEKESLRQRTEYSKNM